MTHLGFQFGIQKLVDFYGAKFFPAQRTTIIAAKMKVLEDADFLTVCEDIIANKNTPPTLEVFMEFSKDFRARRSDELYRRQMDEIEAAPICTRCFNSGYENHTHEVHDGRKYDFAYGCRLNCLAAQLKIPPSYPRYNLNVFDYNAKRVFGKPREQEEGA